MDAMRGYAHKVSEIYLDSRSRVFAIAVTKV